MGCCQSKFSEVALQSHPLPRARPHDDAAHEWNLLPTSGHIEEGRAKELPDSRLLIVSFWSKLDFDPTLKGVKFEGATYS